MVSMYQDHICKPLPKREGKEAAGSGESIEVEDAEELGGKAKPKCHFFLFILNVCMFSFQPFGFSDAPQENLRAAEYNVVCASLSHDYKEAVSFNLKKNKAV